jgi:flagellin-like protein
LSLRASESTTMRFSLKQKKRSAVSPVIATLLLIAIAVAAAIIVYAFVTGLIGGLTTSGASLVVVSGSLTVPSGSGASTLVVTVNNKASNAINYVTIGVDAADAPLSVTYVAADGAPAGPVAGNQPGGAPAAALCLSGAAGTVPAQCIGGAGGSSIPIGSSASFIGSSVTGATAGTTYTFTVAAYIGTSTTPNLQTFSVTAQI